MAVGRAHVLQQHRTQQQHYQPQHRSEMVPQSIRENVYILHIMH